MAEAATNMLNKIREAISEFRIKAYAIGKPEYLALARGNFKGFKEEYKKLMTHYVDYCMMDVELCTDLIIKNDLFGTFHGMGNIYALPAETVLYKGTGVTIKNILLMFMIKNNFTFHDYDEKEIIRREAKYGNVNQIGGITLNVYEVPKDEKLITISYDLSAAYPSAIDEFQISPELVYMPRYDSDGNIKMPFSYTLHNLQGMDGSVRQFCLRNDVRGIMSMFEGMLISLRGEYKAELKKKRAENAPDYIIRAADVNQTAIKLAANASYGHYGSEYNKRDWIHSAPCSSMTTVTTASTILLVMMFGFVEYGMVPVIGVTDSASFKIEKRWCKLLGYPDDSRESMYKIASKIRHVLTGKFNKMIKTFVQRDCKSAVANEGIFSSLVIQKMKRYAVMVLDDSKPTYKEAHECGRKKIVGYSQVRQNTSAGRSGLSDKILDMMLGYDIISDSEIIKSIVGYVDNQEDEHRQWANFERVSPNNPAMRMFQLRSALLYKMDIGYSAPPVFGMQIHVIPVDYGCRCVGLNGSAATWPMGMIYTYAEDAKRMDLQIYKTKIYEIVGKACDEVLGINNQITISVKSIMDEKKSKIKHLNVLRKTKLQAIDYISKCIGIEDLRYITLDILRCHTTAFDLLTTARLKEIDPNFVENKILAKNPILSMIVNAVKTLLEGTVPMMFGGIVGELTVQISMLSYSYGFPVVKPHENSEYFVKSMEVLKDAISVLDYKITGILSHIDTESRDINPNIKF